MTEKHNADEGIAIEEAPTGSDAIKPKHKRSDQKGTALMQAEERAIGAVSGSIYHQYFRYAFHTSVTILPIADLDWCVCRAAHYKLLLPFLVLAISMTQASSVMGSYWCAVNSGILYHTQCLGFKGLCIGRRRSGLIRLVSTWESMQVDRIPQEFSATFHGLIPLSRTIFDSYWSEPSPHEFHHGLYIRCYGLLRERVSTSPGRYENHACTNVFL